MMARRTDDLTPEAQALRDAYLAEMWPTCRELPRDVRAGNAAVAQLRDEYMADREQPSTECAEVVDAA